jgi:hypothetical protein
VLHAAKKLVEQADARVVDQSVETDSTANAATV